MSDYRPRVKKTAENYVKLFILAHGRAPTDADIPFAEFEDTNEASAEWLAIKAKIQVLLGTKE